MKFAVITIVGGIATCKLFETAAAAIDYAAHGLVETGVPHHIAKVD